MDLIRLGGLSAFSIERTAAKAQVAKGLVLYHYRSRARLIEICGQRIEEERAARLHTAAAGEGIAGVDALWAELTRQHDDGTARGWLSLAAVGAVRTPAGGDVIAEARRALLDGCAAGLAAGADRKAMQEAFEGLALALLRLED